MIYKYQNKKTGEIVEAFKVTKKDIKFLERPYCGNEEHPYGRKYYEAGEYVVVKKIIQDNKIEDSFVRYSESEFREFYEKI